jgi:hypothetical protein
LFSEVWVCLRNMVLGFRMFLVNVWYCLFCFCFLCAYTFLGKFRPDEV